MAVLFCMSCKAQTYNLYNSSYGSVSGAYYQDSDGLLNPYVGEWTYENGSDTFIISLLKKKIFNASMNFYEDVIVGEYRYVQNNDEKVNTLSAINDTHDSKVDYNLYGNVLINNSRLPMCTNCSENEKRLELTFRESTRDALYGPRAVLILKMSSAGGQPVIIATLNKTYAADSSVVPELSNFSVPYGVYTLHH